MGHCIHFKLGLRVSRLLDLEAAFGSKSDTPNGAKNCERMITKEVKKVKKFGGRRILDPRSWILDAERMGKEKNTVTNFGDAHDFMRFCP